MSPAITPDRIASIIVEAPGWARVGLTAPSERVRDAAATELGRWLCDRLGSPERPGNDAGQMTLPL